MNKGASQQTGASENTAEERRVSADPLALWVCIDMDLWKKVSRILTNAFILFACFYTHAGYDSFFRTDLCTLISVKRHLNVIEA